MALVSTIHTNSAYPESVSPVPTSKYAARRLPNSGWTSEATPATIFMDHGSVTQKAMPAASAGESLSTSFWKNSSATPVTTLAP